MANASPLRTPTGLATPKFTPANTGNIAFLGTIRTGGTPNCAAGFQTKGTGTAPAGSGAGIGAGRGPIGPGAWGSTGQTQEAPGPIPAPLPVPIAHQAYAWLFPVLVVRVLPLAPLVAQIPVVLQF